jgi:hypothetical protein
MRRPCPTGGCRAKNKQNTHGRFCPPHPPYVIRQVTPTFGKIVSLYSFVKTNRLLCSTVIYTTLTQITLTRSALHLYLSSMHSDHAIKVFTAKCLMKTRILSSNSSLELNERTIFSRVPRHNHCEGPIKDEKIPPKFLE